MNLNFRVVGDPNRLGWLLFVKIRQQLNDRLADRCFGETTCLMNDQRPIELQRSDPLLVGNPNRDAKCFD